MGSLHRIVLATINAKWIHPSLALRLLKANLGSLSSQCEILEFALRQPLKEKVDAILAAQPRILALSVSIWNHLAIVELLKALEKECALKPRDNKPIVVLGGPEVSWLPPDAEIFRHADYIICGEGEESFRALCLKIFNENSADGKDTSSPAKDEKSEGKEPVFINKGETTVDVNKIIPAYNLYTDEDLNRKLIYVEASRVVAPYPDHFGVHIFDDT